MSDTHFTPSHNVLTVKELREMLALADDDTQVVMDDGNDWFVNVGEIIVPGKWDRGEFSCVTLMIGPGFDPRQL